MADTMSIKRTIAKADLMQAIDGDGEFSVLAEGNAFAVIRWTNGQENAVFNLVQGEITVGTPTPGAMAKMNQLAAHFGADIIGAEENLPVGSRSDGEDGADGFMRLAWPLVVVTLVMLLIWRW
ncbi:MAG: hypothetical protein AAF564_02715 [Bacteroidota bacterium]